QKQYVKGTPQIAGDNGKVGVTYTIGKGAWAINFTLLSAEYSTARILDGNDIVWPQNTEKFLVLHYTLQNPNPTNLTANFWTLKWTAIDSGDVNHDGLATFQKEGTQKTDQINIKPGQKLAYVSAIKIPSDVSIPKLIIQRGEGAKVLRLYFKKGEIKPLAPTLADPADPLGATVRKEILVAPGESGALSPFFDVKLDSSDYEDTIGVVKPQTGNRFFVAKVIVHNSGLHNWVLNGFSIPSSIKTDDGEKTGWAHPDIFKTARNEGVDMQLDGGQDYTVRVILQVPQNVKVTELRLRGNEVCRPLLFKIGG
ncbi:MAG: hypothetical protein P4L46_00255, partial [Fimbriimonas sp.]|nr:hypothetical protein [Fimbriimonas sp.]